MLIGTQNNELELLIKRYEKVWESNFPQIITQTLDISGEVEDMRLEELRGSLETSLSTMEGLASTYDTIRKFYMRDGGYKELFEYLSKLGRWQYITTQIEAQSEILKANYQFLFNGVDTDWDRIISSLSWMNDFKKVIEKYNLPLNFIKRVHRFSLQSIVKSWPDLYEIFAESVSHGSLLGFVPFAM